MCQGVAEQTHDTLKNELYGGGHPQGGPGWIAGVCAANPTNGKLLAAPAGDSPPMRLPPTLFAARGSAVAGRPATPAKGAVWGSAAANGLVTRRGGCFRAALLPMTPAAAPLPLPPTLAAVPPTLPPAPVSTPTALPPPPAAPPLASAVCRPPLLVIGSIWGPAAANGLGTRGSGFFLTAPMPTGTAELSAGASPPLAMRAAGRASAGDHVSHTDLNQKTVSCSPRTQ